MALRNLPVHVDSEKNGVLKGVIMAGFWLLLTLGLLSCKPLQFEGKSSSLDNKPKDEGKITDFDESIAGYLFNPALIAFEEAGKTSKRIRGKPGAVVSRDGIPKYPVYFFKFEGEKVSPESLIFLGQAEVSEDGSFSWTSDGFNGSEVSVSFWPPGKQRFVVQGTTAHSIIVSTQGVFPYTSESSAQVVASRQPKEEIVAAPVLATAAPSGVTQPVSGQTSVPSTQPAAQSTVPSNTVPAAYQWQLYHSGARSCYPQYSGPKPMVYVTGETGLPLCDSQIEGQIRCIAAQDGSPSECLFCEQNLRLCAKL